MQPEELSVVLPLVLFPVFFVVLWFVVLFILSFIGGWMRLAEHYQSSVEFNGRKWHFQWGSFGWVNYNNCLTIGSNYQGLYLAVFPLFRPGHPPLLIPWEDITTVEHKGFLFSYLDFRFAKAPSVRFRVIRKLGEMILSGRNDSYYNPVTG